MHGLAGVGWAQVFHGRGRGCTGRAAGIVAVWYPTTIPHRHLHTVNNPPSTSPTHELGFPMARMQASAAVCNTPTPTHQPQPPTTNHQPPTTNPQPPARGFGQLSHTRRLRKMTASPANPPPRGTGPARHGCNTSPSDQDCSCQPHPPSPIPPSAPFLELNPGIQHLSPRCKF